jgi:hypothetical protein
MNWADLEHSCRSLFGWGWQTTLARGLGVDGRTSRRWKSEESVPAYVEAVLESLQALKNAGEPLPARWAPSVERRRSKASRISAARHLCRQAFAKYRGTALNNIADMPHIGKDEALILAEALESQGDVSAFKIGREIRALVTQC